MIWQSNIPRLTKLAFFRACVENMLLYGSEAWVIKALQDQLDGTYTWLLIRVQSISWRKQKTKAEMSRHTTYFYHRSSLQNKFCWSLFSCQKNKLCVMLYLLQVQSVSMKQNFKILKMDIYAIAPQTF